MTFAVKAVRTKEVGNTEKAAAMIAELTGAELFKIEQKVPYAADYDTCIAQAKKELQAKTRLALVSTPDSLNDYDEIYLGLANHWGRYADGGLHLFGIAGAFRNVYLFKRARGRL